MTIQDVSFETLHRQCSIQHQKKECNIPCIYYIIKISSYIISFYIPYIWNIQFMSKKKLSSGINCNLFLFTACPENPDLLVILLGVMGGIVAIGIILLILWKLLTAMVVSINSHIILTEWTEFT